MSIDALKGTAINGATWLLNFGWQCAALVALGIVIGGYGMRRWDKGDIEQARAAVKAEQLNTANLRSDISAESTRAITENAKLERDNMVTLMASINRVTAAVDAIPSRIQPELAKTNATLRSLTNAPEFSCLYLPYPSDGLRALEQAGGSAASNADSH